MDGYSVHLNIQEAAQKKLDDQWLKVVLEWTQKNYTHKITLQDILNVTHFTKSYFCNRFKKLTGYTYIQYVNQIRLEQACVYLKQGISVEQTATLCGFSCVPYFVQLFKRRYGVTPGKFGI